MDTRELYQLLSNKTLIAIERDLEIIEIFAVNKGSKKEVKKQLNYLRSEIIRGTKKVSLIEETLQKMAQ